MKRKGEFPARDLYLSPWFLKARHYAERHGAAWLILSAEHHVLPPERVVADYEKTLNHMSAAERRRWAEQVWSELSGLLQPGDRVVLLAGDRYREHLMPRLAQAGFEVDVPMAGLAIGKQLQWLGAH